MQKIVTAKASMRGNGRKSGHAAGKLRHVHYEPLDDGTVKSETRRMPTAGEAKSPYDLMEDKTKESASHATPLEAANHLHQTLGGKGTLVAQNTPAAEGEAEPDGDEAS